MGKLNIREQLGLLDEYWSPRIVGEINDSYVKLAKLKGSFVWHRHEQEDECLVVLQGQLLIKLRDRDIELESGEMLIIPMGVDHLPIAREEVHVMLLERKTTVNTGNVLNEMTVGDRWI